MLEQKHVEKSAAIPAAVWWRFFQCVYAQKINADWPFIFWFSGLSRAGPRKMGGETLSAVKSRGFAGFRGIGRLRWHFNGGGNMTVSRHLHGTKLYKWALVSIVSNPRAGRLAGLIRSNG